jgi:hypothetical protein
MKTAFYVFLFYFIEKYSVSKSLIVLLSAGLANYTPIFLRMKTISIKSSKSLAFNTIKSILIDKRSWIKGLNTLVLILVLFIFIILFFEKVPKFLFDSKFYFLLDCIPPRIMSFSSITLLMRNFEIIGIK